MILQPGDVLGTLKIVNPEDFDRVKEVYVYTSNILANLWVRIEIHKLNNTSKNLPKS
jgi:hypothetical protein